jgi:ATP-dependent RNA helicase RhlE
VQGFDVPAGEKAEPIVLGRMTIGVGGTRRGSGGGGGGGGNHRGGRGNERAPGAPRGEARAEPRRDGRPGHAAPAHAPAKPAHGHAKPAHGGARPAAAQPGRAHSGHGGAKPAPATASLLRGKR